MAIAVLVDATEFSGLAGFFPVDFGARIFDPEMAPSGSFQLGDVSEASKVKGWIDL